MVCDVISHNNEVNMIKSFNHKGLQLFFESGSVKGIRAEQAKKIRQMLTLLNKISTIDEIQSLWRCHQLKGKRSNIWSLTVSGNWRLTFEFINGDVYILNYEDYH